MITGRQNVVGNFDDFTLCVASVFRDDVGNGSGFRFHVPYDVVHPKAFNLLNHPAEEVRDKCDVLISEFSAGA